MYEPGYIRKLENFSDFNRSFFVEKFFCKKENTLI